MYCLYTAASNERACSETIAGSLIDTIDEDSTYILNGFTTQCEGVINAWEFCYQVEGQNSVTFYPSLWRLTDTTRNLIGFIVSRQYSLIQSNSVTFTPTGNTFSCQIFNLSVTDQFITPVGSVVGLYSNRGSPRPLLLNTDRDSGVSYQVRGNQTSVTGDSRNNVNLNIAIKVHIGKFDPISYRDIQNITECSVTSNP